MLGQHVQLDEPINPVRGRRHFGARGFVFTPLSKVRLGVAGNDVDWAVRLSGHALRILPGMLA
jgi:hypothetical protein